MRCVLSILLENEPGALSRIVGLFSQRAFNIESLTVAPTDDHSLSRMTIETRGDERVIEQILKQVNKLVDVLKVTELTEAAYVERELMLVKLNADDAAGRADIQRCCEVFRGQIVDMNHQTHTVQLIGAGEKLDAFLQTLRNMAEVVEVVRSGVVGLSRGEKALKAS